jgi:hypothetical protein
MKMRNVLAVFLIVVMGFTLFGCATEGGYYDTGRSAGVGALGGAATGAALGSIIGAATGSPATGAWVGAATGAVVGGLGGYLYAEHRNSLVRSRQAAAQTYNYSPSQGNLVQIDQAYASPASARPGQQITLAMGYTVLTPDNTPTQLTISREVRKDGQMVGQPYSTQVNNQNGSFTDQVNYAIPQNAPRGTYTVTNRVVSSVGTAERVSYFTVM